MTSFMHELAQGLRTREQYLEEHSKHPIFEKEESGSLRQDYDALVSDLKAFYDRIDKLMASGEDYDEHFEREIKTEHERLSLKIDTWEKKLPD